MQENVSGLYRELLIPAPQPRPDSEEDNELYQPFIPPIPAFLNPISAVTTIREKVTISETTNDIGNGNTKDSITTVKQKYKKQGDRWVSKG